MANRHARDPRAGRSKSFRDHDIGDIPLVAALVICPGADRWGTDVFTVGSIGEGNEPIVTAAEQLGNAADEPDAEPSVSIRLQEFEDRESAEAAMDEGRSTPS